MTEVSRHRASSRLVNVGDELEQYTAQADRLAAEGDYAALGDGLGRLRELRKTLSRLERHVEGLVAALLPSKRTIVPGVVGMERKSSTNRTGWQTDGLLDALLIATEADENGEIDHRRHAERFLAALRECASVSWKVTGLRVWGFTIDEWCHEDEPKVTVQVWRPDDE